MLGLFYLDYCDKPWPRSARKMIIGFTKDGLLKELSERNIPEGWLFWLSECRTPGYLVEGKIDRVTDWINLHMPEKFGEPLRNIND